MRLLWISAGPKLPTGFGRATKHLALALKQAGHEVAVADTTKSTPPEQWEGITIYPGIGAHNWARAIHEHRAEGAVLLFSLWVEPFKSFAQQFRNLFPALKIALYAPFEYLTLSELYFQALLGANLVLVPNKLGAQYLSNHIDPEHVVYVPHGVDINVFRPIDKECRDTDNEICQFWREGRAIIGNKLAYLFVSRNNLRKEIATLIQAYRLLPERARRRILLALYTRLFELTPSAMGQVPGWDISRLIAKYQVENIRTFDLLATPEWGIPDEALNALYNLADVYVHPSAGEGFGFPLIEAMAAGRPVIASANTSMLEFCGEAEEYCLLAKPMGFIESWEGFAYTPTDPVSLSDKMLKLFEDEGLRKHYAQKARERAMEYTWEWACELMLKAVDRLEGMTSYVSWYRAQVLPEDFELNSHFSYLASRLRQ